MLETMMSQLMSKDVLYEPLKELYDKVWLSPTACVHRTALSDHLVPVVPFISGRPRIDAQYGRQDAVRQAV